MKKEGTDLLLNLKIECDLENYTSSIDNRLKRPNYTKPCHEIFTIKEEEIFINQFDPIYRYYQLCPKCGYIVNVKSEMLNEQVKERIEKRCAMDPNLFRKMYLYSELFCLDKKLVNTQKKLIKK